MEQDRIAYDLFTGKKTNAGLIFTLAAGRAIAFTGKNYYVLKLWALYNHTYYLVKNHSDATRYTVFAKKIEDEAGAMFQNPVGTGFVSGDLTSHLEIKFHFPRQSVFMSLYPNAA